MKISYSIDDFKRRFELYPSSLLPTGDIGIDFNEIKSNETEWAQAAVLILLAEQEGEARIILTKRASHLRDHAGQIAFPGGKATVLDKILEDTALREAQEEIGIDPLHINLLGRQPVYYTGTRFAVTPVVGIMGTIKPFKIDKNEVAEVFHAPLSFLMDPVNHISEQRLIDGKKRSFYAMRYQENYIWGATAGILRALYERLYQ